MPSLVLVTGGAGWTASWCIKDLLEHQFNVRTTVRNLDDTSHYEFLRKVCPEANTPALEIVQADLLVKDGWDAACAGCEYVLHVAGVVNLSPKNVKRDLLEPALRGIQNLFSAAQRSGTVKRIVLTSSMAAVSEDFREWKTKTYGAADFNRVSSPKHNPYFYSKVAEEDAARKFCAEHSELSLVVICPNSIVGPSLNTHPGLSTGEALVNPLLGKVPFRIPFGVGWIDVRDLARIHVQAMVTPQADGKRYIASQPYEWMDHALDLLVDEFPEYKSKVPKTHISGGLVLGIVRLIRPVGDYRALKWTMNKLPKLDNADVQTELQVEYRPLKDTVHDTAVWIRANQKQIFHNVSQKKHLKKKKKKNGQH